MKGYNLPDNVSPTDLGAPWNEEEKEEDFPDPLTLLECPVCKLQPHQMNVLGFESEWEENGQAFFQRAMVCDCEENDTWTVTYKLLPIKLEAYGEEG